MAFPKPDDATKAFFDELVHEDPRVTVRPMFGNFAAFVKGNMFLSVFGDRVAVKLSEADQAELLVLEGAEPFEPMKGRPMRGYVTLPDAWRDDLGAASEWDVLSGLSGPCHPRSQEETLTSQAALVRGDER